MKINNPIINKKKIVLIHTLNSLINKKNYSLFEDYSLLFLNNFSCLDGFNHELLLKKLLGNRSIIEMRLFFIIFESITRDYYLSINEIKKIYNKNVSKKIYTYLPEMQKKFIVNSFLFFLETNKNFKSDMETYIEYVPTEGIVESNNDYVQTDILVEQLFAKSFFDNCDTVGNKETFVKQFIKEYNINNKDTALINNLNNKYEILLDKIKIIYNLINVTNQKEDELELITNIVHEEKEPLVVNKQNKYNNILNPFFPPKIERKEQYLLCNQIAYYNIDKFDENIKKEIYDIVPNASNYSLPYNKNKILLQVLAKEEIYSYAKESIDELISLGINLHDFVFLRIYDIHKSWSNFKTSFSTEYKDFSESQAIKEKDYFEIILEHKKGTATREYLDLFLKEQKYEYFDLLHEDEFEAIVNEALYNWERNIKDVSSLIPNGSDFFKDVPYAPVFNEDKIEKFTPEYNWIENRITFDINKDETVFKNINSLKDYYKTFLKTNLSDLYELLKKLKEETIDDKLKLFWFEIFKKFEKSLENVDINNEKGYAEFIKCVRTRVGEINDFFKNSFNSSSRIEKIVYEQEKWLFEYNKKILESKKKAIKDSLEEYCKNS